MQLKLFIVPVKNLETPEGKMNSFLRSHRVLAVRKEFLSDGENSFWTFCVEYLLEANLQLEVARHLVRLAKALTLFSNQIRVCSYIYDM